MKPVDTSTNENAKFCSSHSFSYVVSAEPKRLSFILNLVNAIETTFDGRLPYSYGAILQVEAHGSTEPVGLHPDPGMYTIQGARF